MERSRWKHPRRNARALAALATFLAIALTVGAQPASAAGTQIKGTVTSDVTKAALPGVEVCEYAIEGGAGDACATTNSLGEYTLAVGRAGEFVVYFDTTVDGLVPRTFYHGVFTSRGATVVKVGEGGTKSGIDEAIKEGGRIAGEVLSSPTKSPLQGAEACAQLPNVDQSFVEPHRMCATTNAAGVYLIKGLTPGNGVPEGGYEVEFTSPSDYIRQYYEGKLESWAATLIPINLDTTVAGVDAELEEGGQISGDVTSQVAGEPVAGAQVCAEAVAWPEYCAKTNAKGEYTIAKLPSHEYRVHFSGRGELDSEYIGQYYEEKEWPNVEPVDITAPQKVAGINAALKAYGRIRGIVTDKETGKPIEGVGVCMGSGSPCEKTDAAGEYSFKRVLAGTYSLDFYGLEVSGKPGIEYLSQYEANEYIVQEELKARNPEAAEFHVTMGGTTVIDDGLEEGGQITGKMLEAGTKTPVSIWPCAEDLSTGHPEQSRICPYSVSAGAYSISRLPPGRYRVQFGGGIPAYYFQQFYKNKDQQGEAQELVLESGKTLTGIDASLTANPESTYGAIAGTVTDASTKAPIAGIEACALYSHTSTVAGACATTGAKGEYMLTGVRDGEYEVEFRSPADGSLDYARTRYDAGKLVSTTDGSIVPSIDGQLLPGGAISGVAHDSQSAAPAAGVPVCAYATDGEAEACSTTESNGSYKLSGLAAGSYALGFETTGGLGAYFPRYYPEATDLSEAQKVPVEAGKTTEAVDVSLTPNEHSGDGALAGTITDATTHAALSGIEVCAYEPFEEEPPAGLEELFEACTTTGAGGHYMLSGLAPGAYELEFSSPPNGTLSYVRMLYREGQPVTVRAEQVTSELDAQLQPGGRITGTVTSAASGHAMQGVLACAFVEDFEFGACAPSTASGGYAITGLPVGSYTVSFEDFEVGLATQYYDESDVVSTATPVAVAVGQTAVGINARMRVGGEISGTVTSGLTGRPLEGVLVCALTKQQEAVGCGISEEGGTYVIVDLPPGEWLVGFDARGYPVRYWEEVTEPDAARPVSVGAGAIVGGIDAMMRTTPAKPVLPPPKGTSTAPATGSTPATATKSEVLATNSVKVPSAVVGLIGSHIVVSGKSVKVRLSCRSAPCSGKVTLTIKLATSGRGGSHHLRTIVLARGSFSLSAGKGGWVRLHLTPEGLKRLGHARRHPVAGSLTVALAHLTPLVRPVDVG